VAPVVTATDITARVAVLLLTVAGLVVGITSAAQAAPTPTTTAPIAPARAPQPGDFGVNAASSADVAVTGYGDTTGYHLEIGRESSAFAWHEVAVLRPAGIDDA
jgi:hypothetical protein